MVNPWNLIWFHGVCMWDHFLECLKPWWTTWAEPSQHIAKNPSVSAIFCQRNGDHWNHLDSFGKTSRYLVGGLEHEIYFSIYWEFHHPNWLIFFRGVETTNQHAFPFGKPNTSHHGANLLPGGARCDHGPIRQRRRSGFHRTDRMETGCYPLGFIVM